MVFMLQNLINKFMTVTKGITLLYTIYTLYSVLIEENGRRENE